MTKEAKNNRTLFEVFLKKKLPSDRDPAKYTRSLDNKIKRFYIEKLRQEFASLFELTDENDVFKIKQDLAANPSLVYRPGRRGDSRIEGLDWYLEYLQSMVSQDVKSKKHEGQQKEKRIRMATPKMEGKHIKRESTVIQRNPDARRKCIEHFGCQCAACGLIMSEKYGDIGDGFIEVHHLNPIHLLSKAHEVDYKTDLIPLCPNCHSMIHKLEDPGDLEGLRMIISEHTNESQK